MTPLTIYFGDLTHDTIGLATEVFPLNVAFVAAYCKDRFGPAVDVRIFKYIPALEEALRSAPPDVLALSNYPWCHNIDMAMFRVLADRRPDALRVLGGPNFPHGHDEQAAFLVDRPLVDAYVYLDGEVGFASLVAFVGEAGGPGRARRALRGHAVDGCAQLDSNGRLLVPATPVRLTALDEIPSPYLMGLLDPFFDGRLSPMIQTNRGCPFKCTFCADGSDLVSKVNRFSIERVKAEINYIAERVPSNIKSLFISDLNFGMYTRDVEICAELARTKARRNYPLHIDCTTGKNSKHRIISAIEKLEGVLGLMMSMQTMTPSVLANIKRDNIRLDDFLALKPAIKNAHLPTTSEVILALPGETKRSHLESLSLLLDAEMDHVTPWTLMLLNGAELATPGERRRWDLRTKFRVVPRDFTRLSNGEKVVEVEEVVVATSTLSFDDYLECRKIGLLVAIVNHMGLRALLHYLVQADVRVMDVLEQMLTAINAAPDDGAGPLAPASLVRLIRAFEDGTRHELWDRSDDLIAFFQDDQNFQGLVEGRYGANLIQTYRARAFAHCFSDVMDCVFATARPFLEARGGAAVFEEPLGQVERFCRGRSHNLLGDDRLEVVPRTTLRYDVEAWLGDPASRPLHEFAWERIRTAQFVLTEEQYRLVEDGLDQFGHDDLGRGKLLTRLNPSVLWRRTVCEDVEGAPAISSSRGVPEFYTVPASTWHYP